MLEAVSDTAAAEGEMAWEEKKRLIAEAEAAGIVEEFAGEDARLSRALCLIQEKLQLRAASLMTIDGVERRIQINLDEVVVRVVKKEVFVRRPDVRGFWYIENLEGNTTPMKPVIYVKEGEKPEAIARHELGALCGLTDEIDLKLEAADAPDAESALKIFSASLTGSQMIAFLLAKRRRAVTIVDSRAGEPGAHFIENVRIAKEDPTKPYYHLFYKWSDQAQEGEVLLRPIWSKTMR